MRAWLHENEIELEERDFFKDRFDAEELRSLLSGVKVADAFAWNSPSFKDLGLSAAELDDEQPAGADGARAAAHQKAAGKLGGQAGDWGVAEGA